MRWFFFWNSFALNTSGGINGAHTHTPHAACFAFKNILIFLFHRELNVIDRPGPFKISSSISISSPNVHAAASPSGNDCPWVVHHCLIEVFLVASSPSFLYALNVYLRKTSECSTHLLWPLLSAHPLYPPFLLSCTSQWVDTYLYLQCFTPAASIWFEKVGSLCFCLAGKSQM